MSAYFGIADRLPLDVAEAMRRENRSAHRQGFHPTPHVSGQWILICGARAVCCVEDDVTDA
jgi:hypothetical protein